MGARKITVTPDELKNAASKISGLAGEYQTQYNNLYAETDALAATWSGKDNKAFIARINGFKEDFKKMHDLMIDYKDFLQKSGETYQKTLDAITADANKLTN